jgi:multimeric flavodoxin WrbA
MRSEDAACAEAEHRGRARTLRRVTWTHATGGVTDRDTTKERGAAMKLVTALVGSGRRNGVTHRATRRFLEELASLGDVESEIVLLGEVDLRLCRGCKACMLRGEELCPLHDDRDVLVAKMLRSDGVVLASPVYSFQVSGLMKAFLDRLGFALHRPRFHGRAFTSIVVEGLFGGRSVVRYLDFVGAALGFNAVRGSRIVCRKNPNTALEPMMEEERRRMDEVLARHARRFHAQLSRPAYPAPTLLQLWAFRTARTSIRLEQPEDWRDHAYYRDRGWFESEYFYPAHLGPLKRAAGAAFDRMAARRSRRFAAST